MIGFIVAMKKEANLFLDSVDSHESKNIAGKEVYFGRYLNEDFALVICGIGKVNAGFCTQLLIDKFNPRLIINFGVAGGKENSDLNAGDTALISKVCQFDFDLSEIDDVNIGYMQDYDRTYYETAYKMYTGDKLKTYIGATGDRFTRLDYFKKIIRDLDGQVVDMECGAIAQVCTANEVPLLILKLISDVEGKDGSIFEQYYNNVESVSSKFPESIKELLTNLNFN